jgi:enoyl-CoA hydratase/carnithine racemase
MADAELTTGRGLVTVTFARDDKLNAISAAMLDTLRTAAERLAEDDEARVLLIRAQGRYFTAGMDIGGIDLSAAGGPGGEFDGIGLRRVYRRLHSLFDGFEASEKPVVVAIQGPCLGVGLEMSVSCDFRIAARSASFRLPEVDNLAVIPGSGGISRLTRLVGPHWTRWIALAGQSVDAEEALRIGLVHAVHADADLPDQAEAFALQLASMPREAVGLAKLAIDAAVGSDRTTARDFDRIANSLLISSGEHQRRIDEFLARKNERGEQSDKQPPT